MKFAIFSDIHGNINNLNKIIKNIKEQEINNIYFLGDIFSKGEYPLECLRMLIKENIICIKGNCDLYLEKGVIIDDDVLKDKDYYENMKEKLSIDELDFIKKMPFYIKLEINNKKIYLSHFLIKDLNLKYPYESLRIMKNGQYNELIKNYSYDLTVFGHTHELYINNNVITLPAALNKAYYLVVEVLDNINYKIVEI